MLDTDFEFLSKYVEDAAGIVLVKEKLYLVESRLAPVLKEEGISSIADLILRLRWKETPELKNKVIDAMTTNETFFFRDGPPFEALRTSVIADVMKKRQDQKKITIWSAACSSGQEPYSMAILLKENFPTLNDWTVNILATDISDDILEKAEAGVYNSFEMSRGLSDALKSRYFTPVGNSWKVKDSLRSMITFEKLNLLKDFSKLPLMDIIFMRNVLIYFNNEVKSDILKRASRVLRSDGYFFLGQSETVKMLNVPLEPVNIASASCFVHTGQAVAVGA